MRRMQVIGFVLVICMCLPSCSVIKRQYRSGFYFFTAHNRPSTPEVRTVHKSKTAAVKEKTKAVYEVPISKIQVNSVAELAWGDSTLKRKADGGIQQNHVPKASLKLTLISAAFLAAAYESFVHYPELSYITIGLLIIAAIFALVAIISSVHARQDKFNNTKGWRAVALVCLLLSILSLVAVGIFLVLLF